MKHVLAVLTVILIALSITDIKHDYWYSLSDTERSEASVEVKAFIAGMSVDDFILMSSVVEAESDRSDNFEGRVLIALTILNRVSSPSFPNSVPSVIKEAGQFQVYYEGTYKTVGRTDLSDNAVIEAVFRKQEDHPNVIYFNCVGYNYLGTPYCYEGGNYFETL